MIKPNTRQSTLKVHWQSKDFEHLCKKFAEKKGLDWYCWDAIGKYWPDYYQGYSTVYLHMGMSSGKFIVHKLIENIIKGIIYTLKISHIGFLKQFQF